MFLKKKEYAVRYREAMEDLKYFLIVFFFIIITIIIIIIIIVAIVR